MNPALQFQLMSFWGAAGKSVDMGISELLWYSLVEGIFQTIVTLANYVRDECCRAAALVSGKAARVNVAPIGLVAMFQL